MIATQMKPDQAGKYLTIVQNPAHNGVILLSRVERLSLSLMGRYETYDASGCECQSIGGGVWVLIRCQHAASRASSGAPGASPVGNKESW